MVLEGIHINTEIFIKIQAISQEVVISLCSRRDREAYMEKHYSPTSVKPRLTL